MRDQLIQGLILIQPLGGGLRANAGDAGNIVRGITDQGEVVDHLFRKHIELCFHRLAVVAAVAHGVDQFDAGTDQLRHVFVAGGDQHLVTGGGALLGERADHIIRFDTDHPQQRQAHRLDGVVQRLHL